MVVLVVTGSKPNINHRNAKCISTSTALSKDTDTSENRINLTPEKNWRRDGVNLLITVRGNDFPEHPYKKCVKEHL